MLAATPSDLNQDSYARCRNLSGGEQQRLGIARLLCQDPAPRFVFLDESTSATSEGFDEWLFQELTRRGMTCVTVSHRSNVGKYHQRVLKLGRPTASAAGGDLGNVSFSLE